MLYVKRCPAERVSVENVTAALKQMNDKCLSVVVTLTLVQY